MLRRHLKQLLILFLSLNLVFLPIRQVQAAINTQNMAGTTLASVGSLGVVMGLATGAAVAVTGGLALGVVGAAILIDNAVSTSSTASNTALSINLNPKVPLITPPGWTAPVAPATQPTPPSTANATGSFTITGASGTFTTPLAACTAYMNANYPGATPTVNAVQPFTCYKNGSAQQSVAGLYSCPTGYTLNSTNSASCNLTTASSVIKPAMGKQTIIRTGNTLSIDPQINPLDKLPSNVVTVGTSDVTVNDSTGMSTKITINSDGSTTIVKTTPRNDGTNKTDITTVTMSPPDASTGDVTVTGTNTQEGSGTGKAASTTPVSTGSTPSIDISSLNKESTQQTIKNQQCGYDDQHKCKLDEGNTKEDTPTTADDVKNALDAAEGKIKDNVDKEQHPTDDEGSSSNPLSNLPSGGSCSPLNVGGWGAVPPMALDICPFTDAMQPLIDWMFTILITIYVVLRFRSTTSGVPE